MTSGTSAGFTTAGARELAILRSAWNRLPLARTDPAGRDARGRCRVRVGENGIAEFKTAESGAAIVAQANPTSYADYYTLALDAFLAKDKSNGEIAEARAVALAPTAQRKRSSTALKLFTQSTGATGTTAATGTTNPPARPVAAADES